jgi:hypothetical protein
MLGKFIMGIADAIMEHPSTTHLQIPLSFFTLPNPFIASVYMRVIVDLVNCTNYRSSVYDCCTH